jgi:arylsulfatase A
VASACLARWPGRINPGTTSETPVIGSDMFPTMLGIAGVKPPAGRVLDGVNALPALTGTANKLDRPQPLFWRLHMAPNAKLAMRVDDWKILANAELTEFELYNLKADVNETSDLKDKEPQRFAALRDQLLKHNAAIDAEGPDWWKTLSPNGGKAKGAEPAKKKGKKQ